MTDLNIVTMQMCAQLEKRTYHVEGSISKKTGEPNVYTVDLGGGLFDATCTCPAFAIQRNRNGGKNSGAGAICKHITHILQSRCEWHEQVHGPTLIDGMCPYCGGPTVTVRVGV